MGIRLKNIYLVCFIFLFNCKSENKNNDSYTKEEYILAYKKMVLYGCINEKTNNEFRKIMIRYNNVNSTEVAILFHAVANRADSIGGVYSKKIKPYTYYGDLKGKVPLFGKCVEYAFGTEVDSIAKKTYKETRE